MKGDINLTFEIIRSVIGSIIEEYFYYVFVICGLIVSYFVMKMNKLRIRKSFLVLDLNEARKKPKVFTRNKTLEENIIKSIKNNDSFFDSDSFYSWTTDMFQKFCTSYSNNELSSITALIEPNYYEQLSKVLSNNTTMQIHHEFNCKETLYSSIVSHTTENGIEFVEVVISATIKEYKEDTLSHIIFYGDKKGQSRNLYKLKFGRKNGSLSSENNHKYNCPNCSGVIDNFTNICPYCKSLIIENGQVWTLYNIEKY